MSKNTKDEHSNLEKGLKDLLKDIDRYFSPKASSMTADALMRNLDLSTLKLIQALSDMPISRDMFYNTQLLRAFFVVARQSGKILTRRNASEYTQAILDEVKKNIQEILSSIQEDRCSNCADTCPECSEVKEYKEWPNNKSLRVH